MIRIDGIGLAFFAAIFATQVAAGQASVKGELSSSLVNKAFFLKSTCQNSPLSLNAQGAMVGGCAQGAWTIHSLFHIQSVKLTDQTLKLQGIREVDTVIAADNVVRSKSSGLSFPDLDRLKLTIQLSSPLTDMLSANVLLAKVFASTAERKKETALYQKAAAAFEKEAE